MNVQILMNTLLFIVKIVEGMQSYGLKIDLSVNATIQTISKTSEISFTQCLVRCNLNPSCLTANVLSDQINSCILFDKYLTPIDTIAYKNGKIFEKNS
jgi:hypothetical protein